ncbi:hypothetical protein [Iningainema tapete]|uniref:Uncharacterized protein n=1 Tax=Iningainema tapete BLCC-T55 TaxID=2748662 RepID=A0A8J6XLF9_9CYAN|nr:hypothetical protein [Iningainema tapete]MBD2776933.1 hypothetical protein [Iningainema tapete BLCC-T55]
MKKSKKFDCVEMKRHGVQRISEQTKDMTLTEIWSHQHHSFERRGGHGQ